MSIKDTAKSTLNRVRTRAFIDQQDQGDKLSPPPNFRRAKHRALKFCAIYSVISFVSFLVQSVQDQ